MIFDYFVIYFPKKRSARSGSARILKLRSAEDKLSFFAFFLIGLVGVGEGQMLVNATRKTH